MSLLTLVARGAITSPGLSKKLRSAARSVEVAGRPPKVTALDRLVARATHKRSLRGSSNYGILAHELGHASNSVAGDSSKLISALRRAYHIPVSVPVLASQVLSNKKLPWVASLAKISPKAPAAAASSAAGLLASPRLAEEAVASIKALSGISKAVKSGVPKPTGSAAVDLGLAYGTYLGLGGAAALAAATPLVSDVSPKAVAATSLVGSVASGLLLKKLLSTPSRAHLMDPKNMALLAKAMGVPSTNVVRARGGPISSGFFRLPKGTTAKDRDLVEKVLRTVVARPADARRLVSEPGGVLLGYR